jgi:Protein of unknown function (DUF3301)
VALARLRLTRTSSGWLAWQRTYIFEFSESGTDRRKGRALVAGQRVESVQLDNPQGVTILNGSSSLSSSTQSNQWHGVDLETQDHKRLR